MYNIKVIFTFHSKVGKYNAKALCDAIYLIKPDVIFEELPMHYHAIAYKHSKSIAVEIDAIKMYLNFKVIDHIPIDTYGLSDTYYKNEDEFNNQLSNIANSKEGKELELLTDNHLKLTSLQGLSFLNSDESEFLLSRRQHLLHEILKHSNYEKLQKFEREQINVIDKREYEMITNIYKYSEYNHYGQAIMFIGCGHRSTILKVIERFEIQEKLKLNWSLHET